MVNDELRAAAEEVDERNAARVALESINLVHPTPRQFPPLLRHLVAAHRQLFLGLEQLGPRYQPFFTCSGLMVSHSCISYRMTCSNGMNTVPTWLIRITVAATVVLLRSKRLRSGFRLGDRAIFFVFIMIFFLAWRLYHSRYSASR